MARISWRRGGRRAHHSTGGERANDAQCPRACHSSLSKRVGHRHSSLVMGAQQPLYLSEA